MHPRMVWTALAVALSLIVISFTWLVASLAIPEEDEDWRFTQPLAGSVLPDAPSFGDLRRPFVFGPESVEFETLLPSGEYMVALTEEAPIRGGNLIIRNETGHVIGEAHWLYNPTAMGMSSYCGMQSFTGGLANFSFTGKGRALLLQFDPIYDLQDGSARVDVQGDFASSVPLSFMQQEREPTSRLNIRWSSASSMRIKVLDEEFHILAASAGSSGDFELRSGKSSGIFYVIEGNGEAQIDLWFAPRSVSLLPVVFFAGSVAALAVLGLTVRRTSAQGPPQSEPKISR
jgi:hypothetical protein